MRNHTFSILISTFGIFFLNFTSEIFGLALPDETDPFYGSGYDHSDHGHYDTSYHQHDGPYGNSNLNQGNCRLPEAWIGKWFLSGNNLQPVTIDNKSIGTKGVCLENSDDQFLFYDAALNCHKCLVINERHRNVLQYKESPDCEHEKDLLENLCSTINGDAQLYSLFRLETQPEECPFRGAPFNFTYNRGQGECKDPVSRLDACTEPSRLLLRFEACPNVDKTESKLEELECFAHWREGSNHYLMGKLETPLGNSNYEEKYRCFIWKRIKELDPSGHATIKYKVAESGDASCQGVQSATEGARTLTLIKGEHTSVEKCKFPHWITSHHWHTLDGKISIKSHNIRNMTLEIIEEKRKNATIHSGIGGFEGVSYSGNRLSSSLFNGGARIICQSRLDISSSHVSIVAHHTEGCKSETVCLNLYKRDSHVIEMRLQKKSSHEESECSSLKIPEESDVPSYVTLVSATASSHRCPNLGKYMATGVSQDGRVVRESCGGNQGGFNSLVVGCGDRGTMEFHSKCATQEPITSFSCHGSWREGETGFLIASPLSRSSTSARRFCFIYTHAEAGLRVSSSPESCRRNISPGVEGNWAFNLTTYGQCAERLTSGGAPRFGSPIFLLFISVIHHILSTFTLRIGAIFEHHSTHAPTEMNMLRR